MNELQLSILGVSILGAAALSALVVAKAKQKRDEAIPLLEELLPEDIRQVAAEIAEEEKVPTVVESDRLQQLHDRMLYHSIKQFSNGNREVFFTGSLERATQLGCDATKWLNTGGRRIVVRRWSRDIENKGEADICTMHKTKEGVQIMIELSATTSEWATMEEIVNIEMKEVETL